MILAVRLCPPARPLAAVPSANLRLASASASRARSRWRSKSRDANILGQGSRTRDGRDQRSARRPPTLALPHCRSIQPEPPYPKQLTLDPSDSPFVYRLI